jgi:glyoxylase I family protein
MKFSGIDHCTVMVTDRDLAAAFYRDVLGLQEVRSPSTFDPAGMKVRWFKIGSQYIHLYQSPERDTPSKRHVALHVDDAVAARKFFTEKGVTIRETVAIPGADRFFVSDPDGNRIEIIEWKDTAEIQPL